MKNQEIIEKNKTLAHPTATLKIANYGVVELELYQDVAYNTVANFISLAKSGYYNGLIFHRVIEGFMIQGGDPTGTGCGGPGYVIKGEFAINGFKNDISHVPGVILWLVQISLILQVLNSLFVQPIVLSWTDSTQDSER